MIRKYIKAIIITPLILSLTSCVTISREKKHYLEVNNVERAKDTIYFEWEGKVGNFTSKYVDDINTSNTNFLEYQDEIEKIGFKLVNKNEAKYNVKLVINGKSDTYIPKKEFPWLYAWRITWLTLTVFSAAIIPYYSETEQNFKLFVTDNSTKKTMEYQTDLDYKLWISIFLLYKGNLDNVNKIRAKTNLIAIKELFERFKIDSLNDKI